MTNAINPSHYKSNTIECIDAMKACSTPEEFRGHLKLTVLKYLWREDKKGEGDKARVENLEKAAWYLERLVRDLRGDEAKVWPGEDGFTYVDRDAIPPHMINAADQGWIEWRGGECPVPYHSRVDITFGGNDYLSQDDAGGLEWAWRSNGAGGDITRYRIVK